MNVHLVSILTNYCYSNNAHLIQASGILVNGLNHHLYNANTPLTPDTTISKANYYLKILFFIPVANPSF